MKLIFNFDFIDEEHIKTFTLGDGIVRKEEVTAVLSAINHVHAWAIRSIYQPLFAEMNIILSDCPGDNIFAQVKADDFSRRVFIEMNVLEMIDSYNQRTLFKEVFKNNIPTLTEYTSFFLLHELGHIVHAHLVILRTENLYERITDYAKRYAYYYDSLDRRFPHLVNNQDKIKKAYRMIPSEKYADDFAAFYGKKIERR